MPKVFRNSYEDSVAWTLRLQPASCTMHRNAAHSPDSSPSECGMHGWGADGLLLTHLPRTLWVMICCLWQWSSVRFPFWSLLLDLNLQTLPTAAGCTYKRNVICVCVPMERGTVVWVIAWLMMDFWGRYQCLTVLKIWSFVIGKLSFQHIFNNETPHLLSPRMVDNVSENISLVFLGHFSTDTCQYQNICHTLTLADGRKIFLACFVAMWFGQDLNRTPFQGCDLVSTLQRCMCSTRCLMGISPIAFWASNA